MGGSIRVQRIKLVRRFEHCDRIRKIDTLLPRNTTLRIVPAKICTHACYVNQKTNARKERKHQQCICTQKHKPNRSRRGSHDWQGASARQVERAITELDAILKKDRYFDLAILKEASERVAKQRPRTGTHRTVALQKKKKTIDVVKMKSRYSNASAQINPDNQMGAHRA